MTDTSVASGATKEQAKPVSVVTAEIQSSHDLGHLFRSLAASLFGVSEQDLHGMRSMPVPSTAQMTVARRPFLPSWYSTTLPGAAEGTKWALYDPALAVEQSWVFTPYPDATIEGKWAWVRVQDAPPVFGWQVTATMVMDPDTTVLRTIDRHRSVVGALAVSGRRSLRFRGAPDVLHMAWLSDYMAPDH